MRKENDALRYKVLTLENEQKEFEMDMNELKEENKRLKMEKNLKKDKFEEWGAEEIVCWILSLDLEMYGPYEDALREALKKECMNGQCLHLVGKDDLIRWGITNFEHFTILHQRIQELVKSKNDGGENANDENTNVENVNVENMKEGSSAVTPYM